MTASGQININGTCTKTFADAVTNTITYGSVLTLADTCDIESTDGGNGVTTFTMLFNVYNKDPTTNFDAGLQTVEIQCTNTLNSNVSLTNNTQTSYRQTGIASGESTPFSSVDSAPSFFSFEKWYFCLKFLLNS